MLKKNVISLTSINFSVKKNLNDKSFLHVFSKTQPKGYWPHLKNIRNYINTFSYKLKLDQNQPKLIATLHQLLHITKSYMLSSI